MLKPERVTFSADDDKFHQFANPDQLNSYLNDSLVHYSTDFKITDHQQTKSIKHSSSLDELSATTMTSQHQEQQPPPPVSAPPSLISEDPPILNENNLHQFDAMTLQQLAIGSNINEEDPETHSSHSTSLVDIQKELDRVKQMKQSRTYSSPLCSRLTIDPFKSGSNNNIDLSSITHSVHFTEQLNNINHLPFSSTYITSIPESIVPASGSPSTNDNHFIPIDNIESPSLEDREVFETFHTKQTSIPGLAVRQPINRNISTSETDLLASLHRSASKQGLDNQSEHGTTYSGTSDDMLFVEWDKERNLFQDYINSLRTEIRVLLQERSEYQNQMEIINNNLSEHQRFNVTQINVDENKVDLLQKSLEEKNFVLEQLQKEYESSKEKMTNLTRKIAILRCDSKAQTGVIDELKQKITELTVDIQNHILIKRRLEISMINLESDCKIIDAERIRLTHDVKETQFSQHELEKLLQQANVQIAEQGSTIEMLRSDNIQVRSQLSATQRRMLQEKQQVMDYLRQIENDLVEKEQIKQRESILRKDFQKLQLTHQQDRQEIDQLNLKINQDKQKLDQLEHERLQLLKTIQTIDDNKAHSELELDLSKSATKRLCTHFKIPLDSIQSIDQLIPMLENRYRTEQISQVRVHHIPLVQSTPELNDEQETEEIRQLREDLNSMNMQVKQLDEANQAWQQYQQNQVIVLRDRLNLTDTDHLSFDDIVQQIENRLNGLNNQLSELQDVTKTNGDGHEVQVVHTTLMKDYIRQSQNTQTEENEEYQRLQNVESQETPFQNVSSLVNENEEELRQLRENFAELTVQYAQLEEANRAWQLYQQSQLDEFRNKLHDQLPIDESSSLNQAAQQILVHLNRITNQSESLMEQLQTSEKLNDDIHSESKIDIQTIQQTSRDTINELNQQLILLKQQNDQLETERHTLNQQVQDQSTTRFNPDRGTPTSESISSDSKLVNKQTHTAPSNEAHIHNVWPVQSSASPVINEHEEEMRQLRENFVVLTAQCAQLDEANRAWQLFQQSQLDEFRNKIRDSLPIDESSSFDQAAEKIVIHLTQLANQRESLMQQLQTSEKLINDLRSESTIDMQTIQQISRDSINELNQQLILLKQQNDQLETERHILNQQLQDQSTTRFNPDRGTPTSESTSSDSKLTKKQTRPSPSHEAHIHNVSPVQSSASPFINEHEQELRQLQESFVALTAQCAQLDEANRAWQLFHQTQLDNFRKTLHQHLPIHDSFSLDQAAQQIIDHIMKERHDVDERYQALENEHDDLRSASATYLETIKQSHVNTINELNQKLLAINDKEEQTRELQASGSLTQTLEEIPLTRAASVDQQEGEEIRRLRENLVSLSSQLDQTNRSWQQYQQTQFDLLRNQLENCLTLDYNVSFDQVGRQIVDQITKEREDFSEKYQALEKENALLRSDSSTNMESIHQSYVNTVNELNQELLAVKELCEQLDAEKQLLNNELERRLGADDQDRARQTIDKVSSDLFKQPFEKVPIHSSGSSAEQERDEVRQLRETVAILTAQCAQLDVANGAWQLYQQTQLDSFRNKLRDYLPIEENVSFDDIAQQIVGPMMKERADLSERYAELEKVNDDLRSEAAHNMESIRQSYMNTVTELNQELLAMKEAYEQLEKQAVTVDQEQAKQSIQKVPSNMFKQPFEEVPIHTSGSTVAQGGEELRQLQENLATLTAQCAQLDEANRAWQLFQQTQLDNFRNTLRHHLPIDDSFSLDQVAQQIVDQITKEREDFIERYQALEKANDDRQSESTTNFDTIKLSYINAIDELSKESFAMKEQCEQLNAEKQVLNSQLEKQSIAFDQDKHTIELSAISESDEIPFQTSGPMIEEETGEVRQLRENLVALTSQCTQLNEANLSWQLFLQSQLNNFRTKLQDCLQIDEDTSFDQIAQQIIDQVTIQSDSSYSKLLEQQTELSQLRENLDEANRSWQQREQTQIDLLRNLLPFSNKISLEEIIQEIVFYINNLTKEQDLLKEKRISKERESQTDDDKIEEDLISLQNQCAELDNANRAWQLFNENQVDLLKNKLKNYMHFDHDQKFDQIIQLIIEQFEQHKQFNDNIQSEIINDNIDLLKQQLIHSQENEQFLNQQIFHLQEECQSFEQQLTDNHDTIDSLKYNLQFISHDNEQFQQKTNSLINDNQYLTNQFNELDKQSPPLSMDITKKQARHTPIEEARIHTITPVQSVSSSTIDQQTEEIQQLRTNLTALTTQCAQLDEANRAWQQFHQNQLDIFRDKLQNWISFDNTSTLEQLAQQIVLHLDQFKNNQLDSSNIDSMQKQLVNYQLNQFVLAENLEQLNQKLLDVYRQCEEYRELNVELNLTKQRMEIQLEEVQLLNSNSSEKFNELKQNDELIISENQNLRNKLNDIEQRSSSTTIQRIDSPRENVAVHKIDREHEEEIRQLRTDLTTTSAHCLQLEEANRAWQKYQYDQIELFRQQLQEQIPSFDHMKNSSLDNIAPQVIDYLNQVNIQRDQLMRQIDLLRDEVQVQKQQIERPGSAESGKRIIQRRSHDKTIRDAQIHNVAPVQSASPVINQYEEELRQLRENVANLTAQCAQLDEANRAWQLYQQSQLDEFRNKLHNHVPIDESFSLDQAAQQIAIHLNQLANQRESLMQQLQTSEKLITDLRSESTIDMQTIQQTSRDTISELNQQLILLKQQNDQLETERHILNQQLQDQSTTRFNPDRGTPTSEPTSSDSKLTKKQTRPSPSHEAHIHNVSPVQSSASPLVNEQEQELRQLQESFVALTAQCAQLDEANRAWQLFHQTQLDNFRNTLHHHLPIHDSFSLDQAAQQIIDHITKERHDVDERYQALENEHDDLQSEMATNLETIKDLNQKLFAIKEKVEQSSELPPTGFSAQTLEEIPLRSDASVEQQEGEEIRQLRENLVSLSSQLDQTNRSWQQYQQTQLDLLRNQLENCLLLDYNVSFDQIGRQIVDQITKEREDFSEKYQALEEENDHLRSNSSTNMESIHQSYVNTVNELNQELLAVKELCEQLDAEKQLLNNELERRLGADDQDRARQTIDKVSSDLFKQPFEKVPIHSSGSSAEQEGDEVRQLRETVAILTAQCAQLDAANGAWQLYQQTQLDSFRNKLRDYLPIEENVSFDDIAQQIVGPMMKERADLSERYAELEKVNDDLRSEAAHNMESIRQSYMNTVTELNQELLAMKEAYEQLEKQAVTVDQEQAKQSIQKVPSNMFKQPFEEVPIHTIGSTVTQGGEELRQLQENLATLTAQCAQLDEANRAWQRYQQTQLDSFRNKLRDYLPIEENVSFDDIAQQIVDQMMKVREDSSEKYQAIEKENDHLRSDSSTNMESIHQSYVNTVNELNQELLAVKELCEQLDAEKQLLNNELERRLGADDQDRARQTIERVPLAFSRQTFEEVPIHSSGSSAEQEGEEVLQLRETVAILTAQCGQLDAANGAWQLYQQTQLDSFRNKLRDYLPIEENVSFDDIAQQIVDQMIKERDVLSEPNVESEQVNDVLLSGASTSNVDELNQELVNLKNQYDELAKQNKQLLTEKEDLNNELNERSLVVGHHSAVDSNVGIEKCSIETKEDESELQAASIPEENEELDQIRADLASMTTQFSQLTQANQIDLDSFRTKLQNWISLPSNLTLEEIAQQLNEQFEQQQQNIAQTTENESQTNEPSDKVHIAIETTPLSYENHYTQIDPINMIDEEIQTESFQQLWSNSDDDNILNSYEADDHLTDYIDEISSLSSIDLANRLNKDCQQILSRQNLKLTSYPNLEQNHFLLISLYSLHNQHLTDEAKQLYNETLIRALKQEYELINIEKVDSMERYISLEDKYRYEMNLNEKNLNKLQNQYDELLEHNELERLDWKKSLDELSEKYDLNDNQSKFNLYNLHEENENLKYNLNNMKGNYQKLKEKNFEQLEREYQQLRQDFSDVMSENELLKDFNSQIYQEKLQKNENVSHEIQSTHDVDIQCNLSDELRSTNTKESNGTYDWEEENTSRQLPIQEQGLEQTSNDEEMSRLKFIISEIQLENENLKDLNSQFYQTNLQNSNDNKQSHDIDIQCYLQPIAIDSYVQTEIEDIQNKPVETVSDTVDNDWNDQISPSIITEHLTQQTIDNEEQQQQHDKLKHVLQTIHNKIHQTVIDRPELFPNTSDDTIELLDHLISAFTNQVTQNEFNKVHQVEPEPTISANVDYINTMSIDQRNSIQSDLNEDKESSLTNRLFGFISNVTSSSRTNETIDNQTQTDEQQDKLVQVNTKLKRALQTMKDKIYQAVIERPEVFSETSDDTIERLDHLISAVNNQAAQIEILQESSLKTDDEQPIKTEQLVSAAPPSSDISQSTIEEYEKQINQFEDERTLLRERLNEVELELRKTLDDRTETFHMYEEQFKSFVQERDALVEQQVLQSTESQQLQEEVAQLKQTQHVDTPYTGDIKSLQEIITQQSDEVRDLSEKYFTLSIQIESQDELDKQKKETDEKLKNYETQIVSLIREHARLLEELQEKPSLSTSMMDNETQTDDQHQEKLAQINTKLKRALQIIKDKIHRIAIERPDLFVDIGEETNERLDHLISNVVNQGMQIDAVNAECDQLRDEIQSLETSQSNPEDERLVKTKQSISSDISRSVIEEYEKQIDQLQRKLSQNEDERSLIRERLNEVEIEFRKTLDDRAVTLSMYEEQLQSLVQERNALVEQQILHSTESQREIDQLQEQWRQSSVNQHDDDSQSLRDVIDQQSEKLNDLNEKYRSLLSQINSNVGLQAEFDRQTKETEERFNDYENQIENFNREREHLLEEIQKSALSGNEKPADDQQHEKLIKLNTKFKRALQTFKDKIHRVVTERPDLFVNIGDETVERLDRIISTVESQATQIDVLQAEHNQTEERLQSEIRELQGSLEAYRYQIENERPIKTEQLVTAAPSSGVISPSVIENYQKRINQLQQKLSQNEEERTLLRERLNEVELEFRKTLDDRASTLTMYEEKLQSAVQERNNRIEQQALQSAESIKSLHEIIQRQSEQLNDLNEKYVAAPKQTELDRQKQETEERFNDYENQIENLNREREHLLEEIQKNASSGNEKPADDQQHEKLVKLNNKLKRALQTFKDKIHRVVTERPDLFVNIAEETSERLDRIISTVENQATQIDILQAEHNQSKEQFQREISELQSSFDIYRQEIDNKYPTKHNVQDSSPSLMTDKIETEYTKEIQPSQSAVHSNDNHQSIQKSSASTENQEATVTNRLFSFFKNVTSPWSEDTSTNDWDDQNSPIQLSSEEPLLQQTSSPSSMNNLTQTKIQQIISQYPDLFPKSTGDILEVLNQFLSILKTYQELQSSFDAYRYHIENERSITRKELGNLSIMEEHQKQIDDLTEKLYENELIHQRDIEQLVEERNQAREQLQEKENYYSEKSLNSMQSQTNIDVESSSLMESRLSECQCQIDVLLRERISLMDQLNQLAHQPTKQHIEIQTSDNSQSVISPDERISRRVFEQEMLAWSKESEQLKQYVKQIQIENKKLTDIILKFEFIIHDYTHENERLKQENQHLAFLSYSSSVQTVNNVTSSDTDVCYLTLKWLTYEVAQRTSNTTAEQSLLMTDDNEQHMKQRLNDTERQLKSIRIQNQRLKKQLETYTVQFKHVQHEMNIKIQELSTLKIETDRLRTSETQYRLEVDRLKADLQCDQIKYQQIERELADLKLRYTINDTDSTNNLRELLELKERELNALKEKLDYTSQAHQLELQEAIKANQFSLDNVQRFEQLDQRHQEKRKELETRLGKFCKIIKPLIDNHQLLSDDSIIDVDELEQLITDTEAEERVISSLGPIRDCLGLLESQMKELHHNLIENHARRSKRWKYKLGFECLSCESQWEVTHDIQNLQEACQDSNLFLESSRVEPMSGCSCPLIMDFIESDVRLCIDDILDEVIVRTTVK